MEKGTRRLIEGDSTNLHNREFPWKKILGGKGETCFVFYLSSPLFAYKTKFKGNTYYQLGYMAQQQVFRFSKNKNMSNFSRNTKLRHKKGWCYSLEN